MKGNLFFVFFFQNRFLKARKLSQSHSRLSPLLHTFRFTVHAFLATQTYGLFCSLRTERKNSTLWRVTTQIWVVDWLKQLSLARQPIRTTTKNWRVTRHRYGISTLVPRTLFRGETSGDVAKCRLFSQAGCSAVYHRMCFGDQDNHMETAMMELSGRLGWLQSPRWNYSVWQTGHHNKVSIVSIIPTVPNNND